MNFRFFQRIRAKHFLRLNRVYLASIALLIWVYPMSGSGMATNLDSTYSIQIGTPVALPNFLDPDAGCAYSGVGGQVFSGAGEPIEGFIVKIEGKLEGNDVFQLALTGNFLKLGPGGFAVKIADHLVASQGSLTFQLLDTEGKPVSAMIPLNTYANCEQNLILLNLNLLIRDNDFFFPIILTRS